MYAVTAEQVLAGHLLPGERILWTGRPDPSKLFSPADKFLIPFSLFFAGFAVFWTILALTSGSPFFALWGLPFVVVGLHLLFGRFLLKRSRRKRTTYAVTNKRFLNHLAGSRTAELSAVFLADVPGIDTRIGRDGSGDVLFGSSPYGQVFRGTRFDLTGWGGDAPFGFFDIPEASRVVEIASRARDEELQSRRS